MRSDYPRDGKFTQFHPHRDCCFLVDSEHWDIKPPDKWQHLTGCYLSQKSLSQHFNKYLSASLVMGISILKEYEDACQEERSSSKVFADFLGIIAGTYSNLKNRLLSLFDNEKITLNLVMNIDL